MRFAITFMFLAGSVATSFAAEPAGFDEQVLPFFKAHCLRCHNADVRKGEFRLDTLSRDFGDQMTAERWAEVIFRMNSGEMPPKKETQPTAVELGKVVEWLSARMREGESARMAKRGPIAHYRLSREEYAFTVRDLLGVNYDVTAPGALIEDPRWHGFERVGAMLTLSPAHVDRYFTAAETVLDQAFPPKPSVTRTKKTDAIDLRYRSQRKQLEERGIADKVRAVIWPGGAVPGFQPWWGRTTSADSGRYRARVQLSGMRGLDGRVPHLSVWNSQLKRSIYDEDIIAPEDKPIIVEFEVDLSMPVSLSLHNEVPEVFRRDGNHTLNVLNGGGSIFTNTRDVGRLNPTGYKLFTDDGRAIYPALIVDWVEWEGPISTEADQEKRAGMVPKVNDLAAARVCLTRLAGRAWRRPATNVEIDRYIRIIESELAAGEKFPAAYRSAMVAVLTSKNFYYLPEGSATDRRERVNDFELASRLSYFLWSSMPDDQLFAAAASGALTKPETLKSQVIRMLADSKTERFTESFPRQWLQLHRVGMFPPDPGLYPDYDLWLEKSMMLESTGFFREVFAKNLSLKEFLQSDWTIVNPRLAEHYGMPPLTSSGLQRVALQPDDHRGGLLTQASVLMLTSDGTRHRPVHRGVLVSEAIYGRTPPPPPPNVEPLEPTPANEPKATIRMQLEAHATHATCASCHRKIDPLGFAFDNFDAIGRWRTEERISTGKGSNPPVNAKGTLPDGRAFSGPDEFKALLANDLDRFAEAFVEQLATYALRRVMTIDDAPQIQAIAAASKADGYRLQTVIENLVLSDLFQKR